MIMIFVVLVFVLFVGAAAAEAPALKYYNFN
jgi:hypothetical protein